MAMGFKHIWMPLPMIILARLSMSLPISRLMLQRKRMVTWRLYQVHTRWRLSWWKVVVFPIAGQTAKHGFLYHLNRAMSCSWEATWPTDLDPITQINGEQACMPRFMGNLMGST